MFMPSQKTAQSFTAPANEAFRFWISFWPVAPLFGVEWRFGELTTAFTTPGVGPSAAKVARAGAEAQERTVEAIAEAPAVAEPVAEESLEAAAEMTEQAIEETLEPAAPEAPIEDDAQQDLSLDLGAGETKASKPKGLLKSAPESVDDLKLIKGIGPGVERQLNELGIYKFDQIAGFSEQELAWVDEQLTALKGRCFRDDWIGQAKSLG